MRNIQLLLFLFLTSSAICQSQIDQTKRFLSGDSSKTWHIEGSESFSGIHHNCNNGVFYTFSIENSLIIRECLNEEWTETRHTWKLKMNGSDINLVISDNIIYQLNTRNKPSKMFRLRTFNIQIDNPITDLIFVHE